jgi:PhzF family phenazine biosynthesis protein
VCLLDKDLSDETKQKLAMEMNLSETAFVVPIDDVTGDSFKVGKRFSLRWFTPTTEVPLCGHATLASAAVLFYVMGNQQVRYFN